MNSITLYSFLWRQGTGIDDLEGLFHPYLPYLSPSLKKISVVLNSSDGPWGTHKCHSVSPAQVSWQLSLPATWQHLFPVRQGLDFQFLRLGPCCSAGCRALQQWVLHCFQLWQVGRYSKPLSCLLFQQPTIKPTQHIYSVAMPRTRPTIKYSEILTKQTNAFQSYMNPVRKRPCPLTCM